VEAKATDWILIDVAHGIMVKHNIIADNIEPPQHEVKCDIESSSDKDELLF